MGTALPLSARVAFLWNRYGPRGKGAVPRLIGRYCPISDFYILTKSGAKLYVENSSLDTYASIYNQGGQWDPHVMRTCERLLHPGDVFYDIGSNTGLFAIDFSCYKNDIQVYAFEPQPLLLAKIVKSINANSLKKVKCLSCLLGACDGIGKLYLTSHSIHASIVPRESRFREIELQMRSIDSLVLEGAIEDPDIVKIDVEGAELDVFKGAVATFSRSVPSIVFEADENLKRVGADPDSVVSMITSLGKYQIYGIRDDGKLCAVKQLRRYENYVALSERHKDRITQQCVSNHSE